MPDDGADGTEVRRTVPLTQLVHLMAEYEKLGAHRQTFLAAPVSDTFVRGCGIVAGGLAAVGIISAAAGSPAGGAAIWLVALVPAVMALLRGRQNRRNRAARLDLFDNGMTVYRSGERVAGFRWDTAEVRQQVIPFQNTARVDYAMELTGPGGVKAAFDDTEFAEAREWGRAIQSAVTGTQLPRAVATIDGGGSVLFGDLGLDLHALTYRDQFYPWERIQLIDARGGLVRIKVDGTWISLTPVATIPNFYIFNELAERLRLPATA
ncbi:hypothetical protein IU433_06745 [Nocardia puris]|nr:hypothetical protein [Nocardia puris]MBF6364952.1 hypothetical protein [Nocardia puris]MBF6458738.1 hypothetical protein [Nocardia puris]